MKLGSVNATEIHRHACLSLDPMTYLDRTGRVDRKIAFTRRQIERHTRLLARYEQERLAILKEAEPVVQSIARANG